MKIIEEKSEHWALGKEFTCAKCQTEQIIETLDDFTLDSAYEWMVYSECGRCGQSNTIDKGGNPFANAWEGVDMSVPPRKKKSWWK